MGTLEKSTNISVSDLIGLDKEYDLLFQHLDKYIDSFDNIYINAFSLQPMSSNDFYFLHRLIEKHGIVKIQSRLNWCLGYAVNENQYNAIIDSYVIELGSK